MKKTLIKITTIGMVTLALAGCGQVSSVVQKIPLFGSSRQNEPSAEPITAAVEKGSVDLTLDLVGNISYNQSAELTWNTNGVIEKVYVGMGDSVHKDDILAELETSSLDSSVLAAGKTVVDCEEKLEDAQDSSSARINAYLTLAQKEKALKSAKLEQEALYYPRATATDLKIAWDEYALANMDFNYAKQDYDYLVSINAPWDLVGEKMQILKKTVTFPGGRSFTMSQVTNGDEGTSERERKFDEYLTAYNNLVSKYVNYQWAKGRPSDLDYSLAEGKVRAAQMEYDHALEDYLSYPDGQPRARDVSSALISLHNAEITYEKRYILATIDGTVTSLIAKEGTYITKGSSALRIDDKSRVFVDISVPEMDLTSLSIGTAAQITVDAVSGKTYSGTVTSVADASNTENNRTAFPARVEITDPDDALRSGMTAEIRIITGTDQNALLVPNEAISYEESGTFVTVYNRDTLTETKTPVIVGSSVGSKTEVKSDSLHEGDEVITGYRRQDSGDRPQMPEGMTPPNGAMGAPFAGSESIPFSEGDRSSSERDQNPGDGGQGTGNGPRTAATEVPSDRPQPPEGMPFPNGTDGERPQMPEGMTPPNGAAGERPAPPPGFSPQNGERPEGLPFGNGDSGSGERDQNSGNRGQDSGNRKE